MSRRYGTVAGSIVDYLRSKEAFHNTAGVLLTQNELSRAFNCPQSIISYYIHLLVDAGIVIPKQGEMQWVNFSQNRPHFVLAQGHETSDTWKEKLGSKTKINTHTEHEPRLVRKSKVPGSLDMIQAYSECLVKLEKALADNNQLREQFVESLTKEKNLETKVAELQTEIDDLKASEHQASVDLIKAHREITGLTSRILAENKKQQRLDRQIENFHR